jgi:putative DNA primase/helicase
MTDDKRPDDDKGRPKFTRRRKSPPGAGPSPNPGSEYSQSGREMCTDNGTSKPGLYYTAKGSPGLWLGPPFMVPGICLALEENWEPARTAGVLVHFVNNNRRDVELLVPSSVLHGDCGRFGQMFYEAGYALDRSDTTKKHLQRYLANFVCPRRIPVVMRTGWYGNNDETEGFMLPREAITFVESVHAPILSPSARTARYALRGTFEQWRDNAAHLAGQQVLGVFRMATTLTSSLLRIAGQEGGAFHLWGTSSGGKSTLDFLAATVWGRGSREGGFSRTWSSTANGFENTAAAGNDIGIFLDDTSHVIDVRTIVQVIYMVSGGQGKTRMHADSSPRETSQFRAIVNSNGESSIPVTLKDGKIPLKGGVGVRCVDIAAAGIGKDSPDEPGAALDAHVAHWPDYVSKAADASIFAYGHAGPMFVRKLIEEKVDDKIINDLVAGFVKRCDVGMNGQLRRVATKIGLVAAAGELAIKFGIFPWASGTVLKAADFVFKGWLERRGSRGSTEMQTALERVQLLFEKHGDTRFDPLRPVTDSDPPDSELHSPSDKSHGLTTNTARPPTQNRLGWTALVKIPGSIKTERRWYIAPQTWRDEICKGFDAGAFTSELEKLGAMEMEIDNEGSGRKRPPRVTINGRRGRYYTVTPRIFSVASDPSENDPDA